MWLGGPRTAGGWYFALFIPRKSSAGELGTSVSSQALTYPGGDEPAGAGLTLKVPVRTKITGRLTKNCFRTSIHP